MMKEYFPSHQQELVKENMTCLCHPIKLKKKTFDYASAQVQPLSLSLFRASVFTRITTKFTGLQRNSQDYEEISGITKKFA